MSKPRLYAEGTSVTIERSRAELERVLARYGADQVMVGWDDARVIVRFRAHGRYVQFDLERVENEREQRRRWRALVLIVKGKFDAAFSGISTFEREFLANIVLPDGSSVGEWATPQLAEAYERGVMPASLLALPPGGEP